MRILIVGASGYVGGRLAALFAGRGENLVLLSRNGVPLAARFPTARIVGADLLDPASLAPALDGVDVAYYLAHALGGDESTFAVTVLNPSGRTVLPKSATASAS